MPYKDSEAYRAYHAQYREQHRAEMRAWQAEYRNKNRAKLRAIARQRRKLPGEKEKIAAYRKRDYVRENRYFDSVLATYGLTRENYHKLWAKQKGGCVICQRKFAARPEAHVDHSHHSKNVRGLLCSACNNGLGRFQEDPDRMRRAIKYLAAHQDSPFT